VPNDSNIIKPDYPLYILKPDTGEMFDLFIIETKAPSNNSTSQDFDKIGNQTELTLDRLINRGIEDPVVCALPVVGKS
jgi:hypothetical protein